MSKIRFFFFACAALVAAAFPAFGAAALPEGYALLPFIKASGNCQVKTGITPVCTDKAELAFELSTVSGNQNLWCSRNDAANSFTAFMVADKVRIDRNTTQVSSSAGLSVAKKYILVADYAAGTGMVTDPGTDAIVTSIAELGTADYDPETDLCLFASYTTDTDTGLDNYGSWTFYAFKLRDADGNLRCDLVPARRTEDGRLGLYDVARDTFLVNGLGGTLTLGEGYSFAEDGTVLVDIAIASEGTGAVRIGDGEAAASATAKIKQDGTETVTLTAVPDEGCHFFGWVLGEGATLISGELKDTAITVSATTPGSVKALFYAPSDVCAKLVNGAFHFYKDATCSPESELSPEDSPSGIAGCTVLFANDAEYQALVPFTNELATAKGGVAQMQGDITLTDDTDWRAMDFDMNGKTVTLRGWDLQVRKPQGTGRITAGNLISNGGFENGLTGWTTTGSVGTTVGSGAGRDAGSNKNKPFAGNHWLYMGTPYGVHVQQTFTMPRTRTCYLRYRYATYYNGKTYYYTQYNYAYIDGANKLTASVGKSHSSFDSGASTGIVELKDLSAGDHTFQFRNKTCWSLVDEATISPTCHLTFDIPEGEEYVNNGITLGSTQDHFFDGMGLQIRKTGKGRFVMSTTARCGRGANATSLVVEEGEVVKGSGAACGVQYSRIEVMDGAQFDINGRTYHDYDYTIAGTGTDGTGALISSAELDAATAYAQNTGAAFLRNVTLSNDATIYAAGNMGTIFYNYSANTMTMGGHTVTFDGVGAVDENGDSTGVGAYRTFLGNMSFSGEGKIVVAPNGWVQGHISKVSAGGCDVEVSGRYWQNTGTITNMNSLTFLAGSRFRELNASPATITVYSSYAPNAISESAEGYRKYPTVQLGDADHVETTLDLSRMTGTFDDRADGSLTFCPGTTVTVDVGKREMHGGWLSLWKEEPDPTVAFVRSENMKARGITLVAKNEGLFIETGLALIVR